MLHKPSLSVSTPSSDLNSSFPSGSHSLQPIPEGYEQTPVFGGNSIISLETTNNEPERAQDTSPGPYEQVRRKKAQNISHSDAWNCVMRRKSFH